MQVYTLHIYYMCRNTYIIQVYIIHIYYMCWTKYVRQVYILTWITCVEHMYYACIWYTCNTHVFTCVIYLKHHTSITGVAQLVKYPKWHKENITVMSNIIWEGPTLYLGGSQPKCFLFFLYFFHTLEYKSSPQLSTNKDFKKCCQWFVLTYTVTSSGKHEILTYYLIKSSVKVHKTFWYTYATYTKYSTY